MRNTNPLPMHDLDAEKVLVGCLLLEPKSVLSQSLKEHGGAADYFYDPQHADVWRAASDLVASGKTCDPISLKALLEERNQFNAVEGVAWLASLMNAAPSAASWPHYAERLRDLALRRVQREQFQRGIRAIDEGDSDAAAFAAKRALDAAVGRIIDDGLPPIEDAAALIATPLIEPPELVYGLLHRGSKLVLGGSSKSYKTWSLIDLGLSVAYGEPFWSMKTAKGRVLYLNFEVQSVFFARRIKAVVEAKGVHLESGRFDVWNLRGHAADFQSILPRIQRKIAAEGYSLVVIDPLYKLIGDADENSAGDMAKLMNAIERLCRDCGAAVAFGSHFAKGNASGKESIDRISGSGVFARDPDSILTLTKHEEEDAFAVEATLRNFKPLEPFVVRWQYPLMRRDDELDPAKLKQLGGRKREHEASAILPLIEREPLSTSAWQKLAESECGVSKRTFYRLYKDLKERGRIVEIGCKWQLVPQVPNTLLAP
jgi:hypothetical protein